MVQQLGFDVVGGFDSNIRAETQEDGDRVEVVHELQAHGLPPLARWAPGHVHRAGADTPLARVVPSMRAEPGINTDRSELVEEPGAVIPPGLGHIQLGP